MTAGGVGSAWAGRLHDAACREAVGCDDQGRRNAPENAMHGRQRIAATGLVPIAMRMCSRQKGSLPPAFPGLSPLTRSKELALEVGARTMSSEREAANPGRAGSRIL
jgi:hypothetical protein